MGDIEILTQKSTRNLVALHAKCHFLYLTKYRNKYRSYLRQYNNDDAFETFMAKAQTFVKIVNKTKNDIEDGTHAFQLD